jgi:hypothetical protein
MKVMGLDGVGGYSRGWLALYLYYKIPTIEYPLCPIRRSSPTLSVRSSPKLLQLGSPNAASPP